MRGGLPREKGKGDAEDLGEIGDDMQATIICSTSCVRPKDAAAVARMAQHVSELTGINEELVKRLGGRIGEDAFLREFDRQQGKVAAYYDATISAYDPRNRTNIEAARLEPGRRGPRCTFLKRYHGHLQ